MASFHMQVAQWCDKVMRIYLAVFRTASQMMLEDIQMNVPVDTGYLRASMSVTLNIPSPMMEDAISGGQLSDALGAVAVGDTLYATFTAIYAARIEYGFKGKDSLGRTYNQSGNHYMGDAIAGWQLYVDQAASEVKGQI